MALFVAGCSTPVQVDHVSDESVDAIARDSMATVRALEAAESFILSDPSTEPARIRARGATLELVRRALSRARENAEALGFLEK